MYDFLVRKNTLTFKLFPTILIEVTAYFIFLAVIYFGLRDSPMSITILVLVWTVPALSFFHLSSVRLGLLELDICGPINTSYLVSTIFKGTLYLWALGIFSVFLTMLIWYPMIHSLVPDFKISTLISANLGDVLSKGFGVIRVGENIRDTQVAFVTLLPIFTIVSVTLQIIFAIPLSSLAASMDGKSSFDPISGIGSYFWSTTLTLGIGYMILLILLINMVLGTSTIFGVSMAPSAIMNEHSLVFKISVVFFIVIFPISYLTALQTSVAAKAYKRYINRHSKQSVAFLGIRFKPKPDSNYSGTSTVEAVDIAALRKLRQDRSH